MGGEREPNGYEMMILLKEVWFFPGAKDSNLDDGNYIMDEIRFELIMWIFCIMFSDVKRCEY